jgi:hypothetical protein
MMWPSQSIPKPYNLGQFPYIGLFNMAWRKWFNSNLMNDMRASKIKK